MTFLGYRYHEGDGSRVIPSAITPVRHRAPPGEVTRGCRSGKLPGPRWSRPHTFGWCWDGIACEAVSPPADPSPPVFKIAVGLYPAHMSENMRPGGRPRTTWAPGAAGPR